MTRVLLLEDDPLFGETLIDLLEENNFEVKYVPNGQAALNASFDQKFDIYLLDINVPLIDGVTLLKELRDAGDFTPTIFLTSHKDREMLTLGFNSGADDYITKPFDSDELLLRINALMRRSSSTKKECIKLLCHDEIHQQILYDNREIELSKKEYILLLLLMKHVDKTVPKELISDELWSLSQVRSDGAIRVYINRIKSLLPEVCIENIRGIGYRLVS